MIIMKIMVINFYIDDSDHDGDNYIQSVVIMMVTSNNNGDNIHDAYSPRKSSKVLTSQTHSLNLVAICDVTCIVKVLSILVVSPYFPL